MIFHVYPNCTGEWVCWIEIKGSTISKTMQWATTFCVQKEQNDAISCAVLKAAQNGIVKMTNEE